MRAATETEGNAVSLDRGAVPAHVPPDLVRDFDIRTDPIFQGDPHVGLASLRSDRPMFYTPRNGGHWVVTDAQAMRDVYMDYRRFTATVSLFTDPVMHGEPSIPMQVDPPFHTKYRRVINTALMPKVLKHLSPDIRSFAIELIENVRMRGACDFTQDVAQAFPVTIFLRLAGLPVERLPIFREWVKTMFHSDSLDEQMAAQEVIYAYLAEVIAERRANPGDDIFSIILQGEVDGRPLNDQEMLPIAMTIFAGGLDTLVNLMSFIIRFLAENPGHRRQLIEEPELLPDALEELMRRHVISSLFRGVKYDQEFNGIQLKAGERLWCHLAMMGLDERLTPDALKVDFRRPQKHNPIFNVGPHFCPGAYLARLELRIFMEEWLRRIPHFRIKQGPPIRILTGNAMGPASVPLEWDVVPEARAVCDA